MFEAVRGEGVEEHGGIFAAQFDADRREGAGGGSADGVGDGARADKGYMRYARVGGEVVGGIGPAGEGLDQVGRVGAGDKGGTGDGGEVDG